MDTNKMRELTERVIDAWNTQDVERVVACYTSDLVYLDPNTRGVVRGTDAFARYLSRLFAAWKMQWTLKEVHRFADSSGGAFLWRASLEPSAGGKTVIVDGMDLAILDGDRLSRNEVYFDRAALAEALT